VAEVAGTVHTTVKAGDLVKADQVLATIHASTNDAPSNDAPSNDAPSNDALEDPAMNAINESTNTGEGA
jgi:acetyl-CoA/propionyl-CoA carboxylase biotin carboxyl carrier protein